MNHWRATIVKALVICIAIFPLNDLVALAGEAPAAQTGTEHKATLKEQFLQVPPGALIEVKLLNKQKMRGRLGELSDEGFNLTTAQGEKISTQKVAFTDVKSFKKVEGGKAGHAVLYILAGVGVALTTLIVIAAASMDD